MKKLEKNIQDALKSAPNNQQSKQNYIIEISPARLLTDKIYEYSLPAPFFNEYLSQIAQMKVWDKVYSGHQHFYYLNDLVLTVNPDGKQTCVLQKLVDNSYYIHPELINSETKECPATEVLNKIKTLDNDEINKPTENEEFMNDTPLIVSLKCNLRFRVYRQIPVSPNRFPPVTKYHFRERRVYRTYSNNDVVIHFEILRPMECPKTFENLLLPKPESKFMIKIWIRGNNKLDQYLKVFSENKEFIEW